MEYYSVRNGIKFMLNPEFYNRFSIMMQDFEERDYFKEKLKLHSGVESDPTYINKKSTIRIGIKIHPFNRLNEVDGQNHIFDAIEFLYEFVSKPGEYGWLSDTTNFNYQDYLDYDEETGKAEFQKEINILLKAYNQGYELQSSGEILFVGDDTVNFIDIEFPEYDLKNIDSLIHLAIKWWKNKDQSLETKKNAIIKLAGVLEYLNKSKILEKVLEKKDTSDLFNIANNFGIRHHHLEQKTDFDKDIWYDWIFQYYLNTCIGCIKLIKKNDGII